MDSLSGEEQLQALLESAIWQRYCAVLQEIKRATTAAQSWDDLGYPAALGVDVQTLRKQLQKIYGLEVYLEAMERFGSGEREA